jgi:hypothetical protein
MTELLGIWACLDHCPSGFSILELGPGGLVRHQVSVCPWSPSPLRVELVDGAEDLAGWLNSQAPGHAVLLLDELPTDDQTSLVAQIYDLALDTRVNLSTVRRDAQGRLSLNGDAWFDPCQTVPPVGPADVRVRLRGAQERYLALRDLPITLDVEIDDDCCAIISLDVPDGATGLPETAWFTLSGASRGRLRIDLTQTDEAAIRWHLDYHGDGGGLVRAVAPQYNATGVPLELAIILDCTCPDQSAWTQALLLARGQLPLAADPYAKEGTAASGRDWPDFNQDIRAGLADALRALATDKYLSINGFSCTDVERYGLAAPPGVTLPRATCLSLGRQPVGGARALFADAAYSPGLDVWDPLDEALHLAREALAPATDCARAVLFVGNSPPTPDPDAPEFEAIRSYPGRRSGLRMRSMTWLEDLRWSRREGIPVFYLFLTHRLPSPEQRLAFDAFAGLQGRVHGALSERLRVLERPADAAGVADGLREVHRLLRGGERWSSCVEFVDAAL